jgi:hypothetical protein
LIATMMIYWYSPPLRAMEETLVVAAYNLFDLGRIVATQGAILACSPQFMAQCLARHVRGDWGLIDPEDHKTNFDAMFSGERILSACPIDSAKPCEIGANTIWIITEGDRSATTFLLPVEY